MFFLVNNDTAEYTTSAGMTQYLIMNYAFLDQRDTKQGLLWMESWFSVDTHDQFFITLTMWYEVKRSYSWLISCILWYIHPWGLFNAHSFLDKYIYIYIYIYIDTWLTKAWTAIDRLSIIWKSDLTDKMKRSFFQAAVVSILLYGCTTWTLTKRLEKKLDGNYTRMLRAMLNKSLRQQPTKHKLYGHLLPIMKTIQARRTRPAGHSWKSKDELISDVFLWTLAFGQAKAGRPTRTYIRQLSEDTGCSPEDLPEAMNDREKWLKRVRDIRADGTTWWW